MSAVRTNFITRADIAGSAIGGSGNKSNGFGNV